MRVSTSNYLDQNHYHHHLSHLCISAVSSLIFSSCVMTAVLPNDGVNVTELTTSLCENENVTEKTECENESGPRLVIEKPRGGV